MAAAAGQSSISKINHEAEISITDKFGQEYTMVIPAKFSNNPYSEMQKIKDFFKNVHISVISNV